MKNKRNLLVTLADENYIDQAKQLFSSVYWNAGWKGDYMLLAHEIPEKKLKWFRDKGILVKKCKPLSLEYEEKRWPKTVFSKFYIFTPYFKKWKNIIFLDADIIVRASLDKLIKVKGFAATKGHNKLLKLFLSPLYILIEGKDKEVYKKLKEEYNLNEPSFNSGMMVFNTSIIKNDTFSKIKKLSYQYKDIGATGEGSILNLYIYKRWKELPKIYNLNIDYLIKVKSIGSTNTKGIILHFHQNKPWNPKSSFHKEWKNNLKKAELINLKKIPPPIKIWTKDEIEKYGSFLKKRRPYFRKFIWKTPVLVDEYIGLLGIFIKRYSPKLYFKLKKFKKALKLEK